MKNFILFLVSFAALLVLDFIWIGGIAIGYYRAELGTLLADNVMWPAAILFYVFYAIALLVFVVNPALALSNMKRAFVLGAFFGFTAYMTYDLTSLAVMRDWPLSITVVDILWGTLFTSAVSGMTYLVGKKVLKL